MAFDASKLRRLDVYALTDADTAEAKAFTTYLGYWCGLEDLIHDIWGDPPFAPLNAALVNRGLAKLSSKQSRADPVLLRSSLLNAWSSELALYLVDLDDAERLWLANQWGQVYSYYATSRVASAWLVARDGQAPGDARRPAQSDVRSGDRLASLSRAVVTRLHGVETDSYLSRVPGTAESCSQPCLYRERT
jgi:hypothetical protein